MIKALIGLGNVGEEYQKTYHNVGAFLAPLIRAAAITDRELKVYPISGYMNESGSPVASWLRMNNLSLGEVVVVHDDSDLLAGEFKLVFGGGSAGHKGVESLIAHLKTNDFWRLRIGVRDPRQIPKAGLPAEAPRAKAGDLVLHSWTGVDEEKFLQMAQNAWPAIARIQ